MNIHISVWAVEENLFGVEEDSKLMLLHLLSKTSPSSRERKLQRQDQIISTF